MTNNFRTIALALRDHISDTYALLSAADAVERIIPEIAPPARVALDIDHETLVRIANDSYTVREAIAADKGKIGPIKALRVLTGCGLKVAKEAIEDPRVKAWNPPVPAWGEHYDEPPF